MTSPWEVTSVTTWLSTSVPFILIFIDLLYNVKKHWKLSLLYKNDLAIDSTIDFGPPKAITKIETLLNFISSEARERGIYTVLEESTLINALANHIVQESL